MTQPACCNGLKLRRYAACLVLIALALSGCAGGSWLDPSEADLPLDSVVKPYPNAVSAAAARGSTSTSVKAPSPNTPPQQRTAAASLSDDPASPAPQAAANQPAPAVTPALAAAKPEDDQKPPPSLQTPLAAVPPHLRHPQPAPQPIAVNLPGSAPQAPPAIPLPSPATGPIAIPISPGANIVQPLLPSVAAPASAYASVAGSDLATAPHVAVPPSQGSESTTNASATQDRQAAIEQSRGDLIAALEADIRERRWQSPADEELPRLEQQLRLLYLAADRMDDAVAGVESLDEPQREAYKHLMFGLGIWLSPDEARRAPLRGAKVLRSLREASTELAAASKLELRNLVFCERVDQYGWFSEFPRNEFQPKQQVILYAEVDNFGAEKKGPQGYETELQGSYQIFDASGQVIAERKLQLDREVCRNYRRDYFLAYRVYMPETIEPGRYRLELTVEDLKASGNYQGRKFGEGMIEFTIRQ